MKEYLNKYPEEEQDIFTGLFSFGEDKMNEICSKALKEGKKIKFTNDEVKLDLLTYEFY